MSDVIALCILFKLTTGKACSIVNNGHFWLAKSSLKHSIVTREVSEFTVSTSIHFEVALITIKNH